MIICGLAISPQKLLEISTTVLYMPNEGSEAKSYCTQLVVWRI